MPKYLQKRRRRWYAVLEVPKAFRAFFGKPRFLESLRTESLSIAELRVLPLVHNWKRQIEVARKSASKGDFINTVAMVRLDLQRMKEEGFNHEEGPDDCSWEGSEDDFFKMVHEDVALDAALGDGGGTNGDGGKLFEAVGVVHSGKILLAEHIDEFLSTLSHAPKSIDMMRRDLNIFAKEFVLADNATRLEVKRWANVNLHQEQGLALGTRTRMISACRGYWNYLEDYKGLTLAAPFNKVLPSKSKKQTKADVESKRKAFRVTDYHKLLAGCSEKDRMLTALIKLAAYTGCRIEELCSLKIENVQDDKFEVVFAKSEAGWRTIPIHKNIKGLVAKLVDVADGEYLISGLSFNKYGDRSNAIGKRFGRLKVSLGYGTDYVFHSLRKGFATQLENAGVSENTAARLMGHTMEGETFGNYSDGLVFERLKDAVEKVDWKN